MYEAAGEEGEDKCRYIIEVKKGDVNEEYEGRTALLKAAYIGNKELCKYLIEKKANVNHKDKMGMTALSLAALRGEKEICE